MSKEHEKKEYQTGQIQDNGLMYDPVYDYNKDGKVDWIEDMERQKDIERSQKLWEERQARKEQSNHYRPSFSNKSSEKSEQSAQGTGSGKAIGIAGIVAIMFFAILICSAVESAAGKVICIGIGIALSLCAAKGFGFLEFSARTQAAQDEGDAVAHSKRTFLKAGICAAAVVGLVVFCCVFFSPENVKSRKYRLAEQYIINGQYAQAQSELSDLLYPSYKDSHELYDMCDGLEYLEDKDEWKILFIRTPDYTLDEGHPQEIYEKYEALKAFYRKCKAPETTTAAKEDGSGSTTEPTTAATTEQSTTEHSGSRGVSGSGSFYGGAKSSSGKKTTSKSSSNKSGKKSDSNRKTIDPYDVNNYSNEEDFYDDHYDDFMDYYEAEDYYNEHHK